MSLTTGLAAEIDGLCELDRAHLGDAETVLALHRQLERLSALTAQASAAFDASRAWEADGARTAAAWLAGNTNSPSSAMRRRLQLGRALRHMPATETAWVAGEVGEAHVGVLARACTPVTAEDFARDEQMLVGHAREFRFGGFARLVAYWLQHADPEGSEGDAERQRRSRHLHLSASLGGMRILDGAFDPICGTIFATELQRLETELFEADWAEARARVGQGATTEDLRRTPAQRRADAAVEMAVRSATAPAAGRRPEPLFTVLVGYETFAGRICELSDHTVVTPGSLGPWLERAWVERVVFDGPSRVLDVGVRRRLFDGATRRAIEVRDRGCFHPLCDVGARHCQVDHVQPWSEGGLTTQDNGRLACGFHNRNRSQSRNRGP